MVRDLVIIVTTDLFRICLARVTFVTIEKVTDTIGLTHILSPNHCFLIQPIISVCGNELDKARLLALAETRILLEHYL